jgi:hypothetical protein
VSNRYKGLLDNLQVGDKVAGLNEEESENGSVSADASM